MIEAVIFDMDGVLIDSEPMWKEAEKLVFSSVGIDVTDKLSAQTAFMTTREVTQFWYKHYPWKEKSVEQMEFDVIEKVGRLIREKGRPMNGVKDVLDFFNSKDIKIGLSTNAPFSLISTVLNKLNIEHYFQAVSSSEDEKKGKPDPAVYLSTARKLDVDPCKCIVFEDSVSGIIAGKSANMKVVAVPSINEFIDTKFDIADFKLKSLSEFTEAHFRHGTLRID